MNPLPTFDMYPFGVDAPTIPVRYRDKSERNPFLPAQDRGYPSPTARPFARYAMRNLSPIDQILFERFSKGFRPKCLTKRCTAPLKHMPRPSPTPSLHTISISRSPTANLTGKLTVLRPHWPSTVL